MRRVVPQTPFLNLLMNLSHMGTRPIWLKLTESLRESMEDSTPKRISTTDTLLIGGIFGKAKGKITKNKEIIMSAHVFERIYEVVKRIPKGKVATYGQVAAMAGNPRWARVVGYALHVNPDPGHIPCFRVVNRFGEVSKAFAFGGENMQIALLQAEGVEVTGGKVDLLKYGWK